MPQTASDTLVECLIERGVDRIFGLPGDGINGIMEALRIRQDRIRFIQARDERGAAFMAVAHAKWTGTLGVCLATTGPGGTNLLTGLYDAKFDRAAVLAITGLPYHDLIGTHTQQDIDHSRVFQDVAAITTTIHGAQHVRQATALACRTALAARGVAHIAIPADVQDQAMEDDEASPRHKADPTTAYAEPIRQPEEAPLAQAAEILNAGSRIAILAGQGAIGAAEELLQTSDLLAAPIAKALLGKAVVPDTHPHVTGGVGYLGARPSQQAFAECDTLLIVGSGFPYTEYYPKPGQARTVQIDRDPARLGLRYPIEAGIAGDAIPTLRALNQRLTRKTDRTFLDQAAVWKQEWLAALAEGAARPGTPLKPQRVVAALDRRLAPDALICTDSGHNTGLAAQYLMIRERQAFAVSGTLASMGCGVPYAIAGALAFPGRQVVAVVGDGGLSQSLAELATAAKYGLNVKIVVINNRTLGQIKWEQMLFLGHPEFGCDLAPVDFAAVAVAMGLHAARADNPEALEAALDAAFAHEGPALVDAVVDPAEPMLPPKRRDLYMQHMEKALAETPNRGEIEARMRQEPSLTSLKP